MYLTPHFHQLKPGYSFTWQQRATPAAFVAPMAAATGGKGGIATWRPMHSNAASNPAWHDRSEVICRAHLKAIEARGGGCWGGGGVLRGDLCFKNISAFLAKPQRWADFLRWETSHESLSISRKSRQEVYKIELTRAQGFRKHGI